ncbi:MAG: ABC transporter ATP-binding protein, partial [Lentisphaerae bacterium]
MSNETTDRKHLLEIRNLSVTFNMEGQDLQAVDHVSLAVAPGEIVGLVGESGCGKSVTAMSILRLLPMPPAQIRSGEILFDGVDLLRLPLHELRRYRGKEVGVIFQDPMMALSPLQRIGDQLREVIEIHEPQCPENEARARAVEWLRKVGIPEAEERYYS